MKATFGSSVATTSLIGKSHSQSWSMSFISQNLIRGNAQSCSSMTTPPRAPMATGMSSRWRIRGCVVWGGSDEYRTGAVCNIFDFYLVFSKDISRGNLNKYSPVCSRWTSCHLVKEAVGDLAGSSGDNNAKRSLLCHLCNTSQSFFR